MDAERLRHIVLAHTGCQQEQRFTSLHDALFGLSRANRCFHRLALRTSQL